jgi:general secretion pathway protein M
MRTTLPASASDTRNTLLAWAAPWRARWQAMGPRERRAVALAGYVLGAFLLGSVAIAPAWRMARQAPLQLDQLDAQLQTMQRMAGEARELRTVPAITNAQALAALRAASQTLGSSGRLQAAGDRATLTLDGVSGTQLRDWLAEARSAARARAVEATLTRGPKGYSGRIVVALPADGGGR